MGVLTYDNNNFYMDGEKYTILSGAIHYFRTVPEYWQDRILKLKACGFNTVETYVCWNLHEKKEGEFDFSGLLDIAKFLSIAQKEGLNVILRPGPYICAEWDFGGLPSWLLKYKDIVLRSYDPTYLKFVRRYFIRLFEEIRPYFVSNGGPIIMVQIENEYGSYANDKDYLTYIRNLYIELGIGDKEVLFTSDGASHFMLKGGTLNDTLAVCNFGGEVKESFDFTKGLRPNEPSMCGELWNGWITHWYENFSTVSSETASRHLDEVLEYGASVNCYMFVGGTNFGFNNGANFNGTYQPTTTSYDYDAPLTEAGDMTEKYYAYKEVIRKHFGDKAVDSNIKVSNTPKKSYGVIKLTEYADLFDNIDNLTKGVQAPYPLTMEQLDINFGYVLYRTELKDRYEKLPLVVENVHDRALIYINSEFKGIKERTRRDDEIIVEWIENDKSKKLDILVENMGRINYGPYLRDEKGILGGVRLGQQYHMGWCSYPLPLDNIVKVKYKPICECKVKDHPAFFRGYFEIKEKADTFIKLDNFTKGVVFINGFNLGRYWNTAGPQKTLYVPAPLLKDVNEIVVFETDGIIDVNNVYIECIDKPILNN